MKHDFTRVLHTAAVCLAVLSCSLASADLINPDQAADVVDGWLSQDSKPFQTGLEHSVLDVKTYADDQGNVLYYCVNLEPDGFVIVSGDDVAEPVIAFAAKGSFNNSPGNPLGAFVSADIPARLKGLNSPADDQPKRQRISRNRLKWNRLRSRAVNRRDFTPIKDADSGDTPPPGDSTIDDVRISPLLESTWGQGNVEGYPNTEYCYNYYTPNHYPAGCVATAMAQIIRYHEYPAGFPDQIPENSGLTQYPDYILMPLKPDKDTITTQMRQEIGMFCYQLGLSVDMEYSSGGSAAVTSEAGERLTDTFGYSNSIEYYSYNPDNTISNARLTEMINPNLDARLPVIISIRNSTESYGHAIVCDGYGFDNDTQYHHLNMGWDGSDNVWYALPVVDAGAGYYYDLVYTCVYNIFVSGTGEIISGRILDHVGSPVENATVTLNPGNYTTQTDSNGIYAFTAVHSNRNYTVSASKTGWEFTSVNVRTEESDDGTFFYDCGNVWAADLTGQLNISEINLDSDIYSPGQQVIITLTDSDLTGNGTQQVTLITAYGDSETVDLVETPAASGVFVKAVGTSQSGIINGNGALEIWDQDRITVEYIDLENSSGSPVTLIDQADVQGLPRDVYTEDFESGFPDGWEIINGGTGDHTWEITYATADNLDTYIMTADSTFYETEEFDEQLLSPVFDCSLMTGVILAFDYDVKRYEEEMFGLDVSVDGGDWTRIKQWDPNTPSTNGRVELDISQWADGRENVRIRWHYYNAIFEWYWAIDNVAIEAVTPPMPPTAKNLTVSAETAYPVTIELSAQDDGTAAADLEYLITLLPSFGSLSDPAGGEVTPDMIPYTLLNNGNEVIYTSNSCFEGWDLISYKASDGGDPPQGGLSNQADVSIRVWPPTVYYTDFSTDPVADGWSIFDGFSDGFTWQLEHDTGNPDQWYMLVDSFSAGSTIIMDESLISPVFDCSDYNVVYLLFDHYFSYYEAGAGSELGDVDIRIDGGSWQTVKTYKDVVYNEFAELDISDLAGGHSQVQFRWRYHNAQNDDFWAVYEMWLLGLNASPLADIDADCDVDLVDFAQLSAGWQTTYGEEDYCYPCDIAEPFDVIEINDLAEVMMYWMADF